MMRVFLTLTTELVLGGLGPDTISASPASALPGVGIVAGRTVDAVAYRHHRSKKAERMMRRRNTMRRGNPNAKNPSMRSDQQNLGNTVGGPRDRARPIDRGPEAGAARAGLFAGPDPQAFSPAIG